MFVTVTEGRVAPEREDDLRSAWEETASAPAGLIQSTLVRGEERDVEDHHVLGIEGCGHGHAGVG